MTRVLCWIAGIYAAWLGMMVLHEGGHVLNACLSGGTVERVRVPLVGFSQTIYTSNPRPAFVAWGGPAWGSLVPLVGMIGASRARLNVRRAAQFFAGFCLVANGAYLGIGWTMPAGDAADLLRHGTPVAALILFGVSACSAGLYVWHRMGLRP